MMTNLRFCAIGFGHAVCINKIYMLTLPGTNQGHRIVKAAKDDERYFDACYHRPLRSLILLDDGQVIGCSFSPATILLRIQRACDTYIDDIPRDSPTEDADKFMEEEELEAEELEPEDEEEEEPEE